MRLKEDPKLSTLFRVHKAINEAQDAKITVSDVAYRATMPYHHMHAVLKWMRDKKLVTLDKPTHQVFIGKGEKWDALDQFLEVIYNGISPHFRMVTSTAQTFEDALGIPPKGDNETPEAKASDGVTDGSVL